MDKNNLIFYITDGREGYPPGDFYTTVLDLVFDKHLPRGTGSFKKLNLETRFERIMFMFSAADTFNLQSLRENFPGVHEILNEFYQGRLPRGETEGRIYWTMRTIGPLLVTALTPLREAFISLQKDDEAWTQESRIPNP